MKKGQNMKKLGKKGGLARWKNISKKKRSEAMRKVALARYGK